MRYLNKIIFLNSADKSLPYAEVNLDGNTHFIGTQGVGKSTLLRAILFFYNANKQKLDRLIKTTKDADYKVHGELCESKVLGKMLNDKVDSAYQMQNSGISFEVPQYVKDAILWLNK